MRMRSWQGSDFVGFEIVFVFCCKGNGKIKNKFKQENDMIIILFFKDCLILMGRTN